MQKLIAASGFASRRLAEKMIEAGRVTVDGKRIALGSRAQQTNSISIDGVKLEPEKAGTKLIMYNKPRGEIVSRTGHATVFDSLPYLTAGRWINIGRLDVDTEGLLLFTTNGDLANSLAHPSGRQEREYLVRCKELLVDEILDSACSEGVRVMREKIMPLKITRREKHNEANYWYEVVLGQGRNRVVRRMFETLGARVNRLVRIRFGKYVMPQELKPGFWMAAK